ncbi:MAG TPA: UvrD-helicase domain-containing protein [Gemmatimonadaceae bacterium]
MPANGFIPTTSQQAAIEAPLGPALVLAGPGAGKTFCLIERIRFLIDRVGLDPARINAFTFTNKAAEEIGSRLDDLGASAQLVKRGTIHAFCADLLRHHGHHEGLERGFGIADENYQRSVLARLGQPAKFHTSILTSFTLHRLKGFELSERDARTFTDYVKRLERWNMADFDMLVVKAAHLLQTVPAVADDVRARWDYILVDEFQDLNQKQYEVVRALGCRHRNVFGVGDDEQSIFSWTGADNTLFRVFQNDFEMGKPITLRDNHRCPRQVFELAKSLVRRNPRGAWEKEDIVAVRETPHPVRAINFGDELVEGDWVLDDIVADRRANNLRWGDYAVLYRRHEIGDALEATLIGAGVPCRLAQGRAIADDTVIAYVVAALKVIADPSDDVNHEEFLRVVLPPSLLDLLRTKVEQGGDGLRTQMETHARSLGRRDPSASKLWRALFALRNLESLGRKHDDVTTLVEELLSQRVGVYRTMLEERHEELSDPSTLPDITRLADRLGDALADGRMVWVAPMHGLEIPLRELLRGVGFTRFGLEATCPADAEPVEATDCPSTGIALGVFKALQIIVTRKGESPLGDFTAVDIETTDRDVATAEIVDLAAVRVRGGRIVDEWSSLVRPRARMHAAAAATHGITEQELQSAPWFEDVWERFRDFCGKDVLIAHNGYRFDFPILERMSQPLGGHAFVTYDTLVLARELHPGSRRLGDLAERFRIAIGTAHRALDDSRALAHVFLRLDQERLVRARKTALANLLDWLGIALALDPAGSTSPAAREVSELRDATAVYALGRYSDALEHYRVQRELAGDGSIPAVDDVIGRLGGAKRMARLRSERSADDRYPQAMSRLRRLMLRCDAPLLDGQIRQFLELVALSRHDGSEVHQDRVSLLTLHSTKGLEFSRVYVVGVEDSELPGSTQHKPATKQDLEESRRLLYVGMTRAKDRLILTRTAKRGDLPTGGIQFIAEMGLSLDSPNPRVDGSPSSVNRK